MKVVFIALVFRILICLAVSGLFCAIMCLLSLSGMCDMPSLQVFLSVAVIAFLFVVIYDTYIFLDNDNKTIVLMSEEEKKRIKKELAHFSKAASEIDQKEKAILDDLASKGIVTPVYSESKPLTEIQKAKRDYMRELRNTSAYSDISLWVTKTINKQYVLYMIEQEEEKLLCSSDPRSIKESKEKIEKGRKLLETDLQAALDLFTEIGTCHHLWSLESKLLKETFGVRFYSPQELHPDFMFD